MHNIRLHYIFSDLLVLFLQYPILLCHVHKHLVHFHKLWIFSWVESLEVVMFIENIIVLLFEFFHIECFCDVTKIDTINGKVWGVEAALGVMKGL